MIDHMNLFVRESGPVGAPAIVFLHGGTMSGLVVGARGPTNAGISLSGS